MKIDEKGVTLIELLAAAMLATLCFIMAMSLWISSEKTASRTLTENDLQQDAQLVQTKVKNAYDNRTAAPFKLEINGDGQLELVFEGASGPEIISGEGIRYAFMSGASEWPAAESGSGAEYIDAQDSGSQQTELLLTPAASTDSGHPDYHLILSLYDTWK